MPDRAASPVPVEGPKRFHAPPVSLTALPELEWWESTTLAPSGVVITATSSEHFSGRTLLDLNATAWSSLYVQGSWRSVFQGAVTVLTPEYRDIRARFGSFDLVLPGIGAWYPAWGDIRLGPEHALDAHAMLGSGRLRSEIPSWHSTQSAPRSPPTCSSRGRRDPRSDNAGVPRRNHIQQASRSRCRCPCDPVQIEVLASLFRAPDQCVLRKHREDARRGRPVHDHIQRSPGRAMTQGHAALHSGPDYP